MLTAALLVAPHHVDPGQAGVEVDRIAVRSIVDGRQVAVRVLPGGMDDSALGVDVGRPGAGQLVVLGMVAVEGIGGGHVEIGGDVLGDDRLGVYRAGARLHEGPAVLPLEVLASVGVIAPDGPVLGDGDRGGRSGPGQGRVGMSGRDVVGWRSQVGLGGVGGDLVGTRHHVVGSHPVAGAEHVRVHVGVVVHDIGPLPDLAQDVVVGARAVDHSPVHLLQLHGYQAAAAHRTDEARRRMPVDGGQTWDSVFADVLVDHVGLLHP